MRAAPFISTGGHRRLGFRVVNRPITTGDKLWTDNDARAELHIGSAAIRLPATLAFVFDLDDRMAQIRITEGTIDVRVRRLEMTNPLIDTPNLAFSFFGPAITKLTSTKQRYHCRGRPRRGRRSHWRGSAYTIHPREIALFAGTTNLTPTIQRSRYDDDDFDHWCGDRDRAKITRNPRATFLRT